MRVGNSPLCNGLLSSVPLSVRQKFLMPLPNQRKGNQDRHPHWNPCKSGLTIRPVIVSLMLLPLTSLPQVNACGIIYPVNHF